MWRVGYYQIGIRFTKTFPSLDAATRFMVYEISSWDVYECYRVD